METTKIDKLQVTLTLVGEEARRFEETFAREMEALPPASPARLTRHCMVKHAVLAWIDARAAKR